MIEIDKATVDFLSIRGFPIVQREVDIIKLPFYKYDDRFIAGCYPNEDQMVIYLILIDIYNNYTHSVPVDHFCMHNEIIRAIKTLHAMCNINKPQNVQNRGMRWLSNLFRGKNND